MAQLDYYDKLLAGIAGSFLAGIVVGVTTSVAIHVAMVGGAAAAAPFVYAALFRNPPLPASDPATTAGAVVWHVVLLLAVAALSL